MSQSIWASLDSRRHGRIDGQPRRDRLPGPAEADLGTKLYAERCSGCHGDDGKGDGPAAAALVPKPRNFRDAAFWQDRKAEDLKAVVHKGKVGTMMPPFAGVLTDAEIDAVVAHVQTFAPARPAPR
jgi:mono/diheme cytochrome c family protein